MNNASTRDRDRQLTCCNRDIRFPGLSLLVSSSSSGLGKKSIIPESLLHHAPAVSRATVHLPRLLLTGSAAADAYQCPESSMNTHKSRSTVSQDAKFHCFSPLMCMQFEGTCREGRRKMITSTSSVWCSRVLILEVQTRSKAETACACGN